jgi:tRNA threonylcarbamoyladenosine biosynthesis protein TsaB
VSTSQLILGIDTCGPTGSIALGRAAADAVEILGQNELAGRSYSATLLSSVTEVLAAAGAELRQLEAIVVVNGPGSFTGIRVGLSTAKGFAEGARIPLVAVSRLEVLAASAGVACAALDAHREEIYLRLAELGLAEPGLTEPAAAPRELLAGAEELVALAPPARVAVCDESAARLLATAWPNAEELRVAAPTAADALRLCAERVARHEFADIEQLDAHYLRRSDAEIFGAELTSQLAAAKPLRK